MLTRTGTKRTGETNDGIHAEDKTRCKAETSDETQPETAEAINTYTSVETSVKTLHVITNVIKNTSPGIHNDTTTGTKEDASTGINDDPTTGTKNDASTGTYDNQTTGKKEDESTGKTEDESTGKTEDVSTGKTEDVSTGKTEDVSTGTHDDSSTGTKDDAKSETYDDVKSETYDDVKPETAEKSKFSIPTNGNDVFTKQIDQRINFHLLLSNVDTVPLFLDILETEINDDHLLLKNIIITFNHELRNMFDNYVCFYEHADQRQMNLFFNSAAVNLEQKRKIFYKKAVNFIISDDTFKMIEEKLCSIYVDDNDKIVSYEKELCHTVASRLVTHCTGLEKAIRSNETNFKMSDLEQTYKRVVHFALGSITRCMDYGGRLNKVCNIATLEMEKSLQEAFSEIKLKQNIRPSTELPTNAKINIKSYLAHVSELEPHLTNYKIQELCAFHNMWRKELFEKFTNSSGNKELPLQLDSHLTYVEEKSWELFEKMSSNENKGNTLCVYFKTDRIQVIRKYENGSKPSFLVNLEEASGFPPNVVLDKSGNFIFGHDLQTLDHTEQELDTCGKFFDYLTNKMDNQETSAKVVKSFMSHLKLHYEEKEPGVIFNQSVVIIPSAFTRTDRRRIRKCSNKSGYDRTFIFNESSLLAYHFLKNINSFKNQADLLVIMDVRDTGVRGEIFVTAQHKTDSRERIRMIGIAEQKWDTEIEPTTTNQPPGNYSKVLQATLRRSLVHLPDSMKNLRKYCIIICENIDWIPHVSACIENGGMDIAQVHGSSQHLDLLKAVLPLLTDPGEVRDRILDYIEVAQDKKITSPESKNTIQSEEANQLLRMCQLVEEQIASGKVQMGVINKRLCLDVVKRAREAVNERMPFESEQAELIDLFIQNKFQHPSKKKY